MNTNCITPKARFNNWANDHKKLFLAVILGLMTMMAVHSCYRLLLAYRAKVVTASERQRDAFRQNHAIEQKSLREKYAPFGVYAPYAANPQHVEIEDMLAELVCDEEAVTAYGYCE